MPATIDQEFHETMIGLYKEAKKEGYTPSAFLDIVFRMGCWRPPSSSSTMRSPATASAGATRPAGWQ